jgi:hypothetical protein
MLALSAELARVKSKQNIPAALAIYHPEIELISPGFDSVSCGSEEVEASLKIFFRLFPDYQVTLANYAFNDSTMLARGQVSVTPWLPDRTCPKVSVPVFLEFQFKDERISKETFFLDVGLICKRADIAPEQLIAAAKTALRLTPTKEF